MKTVSQIYNEYRIMLPLQMHMLRVAAVASLICDSMNIEVEKENIVIASLFHDMGNLIKCDMTVFPDFFNPEGIEHWSKIKAEMIEKYGKDEHHANLEIMREIGLSDRIIYLSDQNNFSLLCSQLRNSDINVMITHYADGRVGPFGVLSYQDRQNEAGKRYKDHDTSSWEANRQELVSCGLEIEKKIFSNCKIKPEDINNETVAPIIEALKEFVVK
jgi:hypothetical protein